VGCLLWKVDVCGGCFGVAREVERQNGRWRVWLPAGDSIAFEHVGKKDVAESLADEVK
jgi:hypothetical protein